MGYSPKQRTGIDVCRLSPHISLKQPFDISDLDLLGKYMAELAGSITPFDVRLTQLELVDATIDGKDTGILWLNVRETKILRELHHRVHEELTTRFGNVASAFDGEQYHFHMTAAIGGQPIEIYRRILDEFSSQLKNLQCIIREMVMFVHDERYSFNAGYMTSKILPLGKN